MKSINTLIKINSRELDELRKNLVNCENEREQLIYYNNKMEDELEAEHKIASSDFEMGIMFANYKKMIRERQKNIFIGLQELEKKIESLKEKIYIKFTDVKKYEILLAKKASEQKKEGLLRDVKNMDEIAVNNYMKDEQGD